MTGLITLREPAVTPRPLPYSERLDPELAYRLATLAGWDEATAVAWAAWQIDLPLVAGEDGPLAWSMREVRHLRFLQASYRAGAFVGDREEEQ